MYLGLALPACPQSLEGKERQLSGACTFESSPKHEIRAMGSAVLIAVVRLEPQVLAI